MSMFDAQERQLFICQNIVNDMTEGVLVIGMDGVITSVNPACRTVLGMGVEVVGSTFASLFFGHPENDAFNQAVLDAIYESTTVHNTIVDYFNGKILKKLFVTTSYLQEGDHKAGVIAVLNDVTELFELKDAIKAMERIKRLNEKLALRNRLISDIFGRYLSDEIVAKLLDTPDGLNLGGSKQEVTIIMSDLRGFTALSERMPPVDLMCMLNNYLGEMTEIIQRYKGTIIEFIGDAIFAIFGQPVQCERPEENAVRCAIEMQNRMASINAHNEARGYPQIEMGIGINTGPVILGNIGSERRAKYGVVGQHVNLAGRIESFTVGGQILVSPHTRSRVPGFVSKGETEILPKGVSTPITIYDAAAVGDLRLNYDEEEPQQLRQPIPVSLFRLDGKFAERASVAADIVALSRTRAKLNVKMPKNTNVKFVLDEKETFAKFISEDVVRLTI